MFKKITTLLLLFTMFIAFGQEEAGTDTLYLKKGKIVVGRLLSDRNDDFLKISVNGKMEIYSSVDIKRISSSKGDDIQDFAWGAKAGFSFASVSGKDVKDADPNPGLAGGLFSTYRFNPLFSMQAELIYMPKGFKYKRNFSYYSSDEFEFNFAAVEVPMLMKMTLPVRQNIRSSIYAGPIVSFITESMVDITSVDFSQEVTVTKDLGGAVNKQQFGVVLGADLVFRVNGYDMACDVRYQKSFTQMYKDRTEIFEGDDVPDITNSNFSVMFGFMF